MKVLGYYVVNGSIQPPINKKEEKVLEIICILEIKLKFIIEDCYSKAIWHAAEN